MSYEKQLIKKYSWILVPLVAFGGLFYPVLGLLVLAIMITLMVTALFKGKYWCGNLCPHGSLFDVILKKVSFKRKIPDILKSSYLKYGFFIFFMAMFIFRIIRVMNYTGQEEFINNLGFVFVIQYLVMPTILGISLAVLISPRSWCSFCPMGTMTQLIYRLGKLTGINKNTSKLVTINSPEKCKECGLCAQACPLELEPYKNFNPKNQFDNDFCMKCSECIKNCPLEILELKSNQYKQNKQKAEKEVKISG